MEMSRDEQRRGLREEIARTREEVARRDRVASDPNERPRTRDGARLRAERDRIRIRNLQGRIDWLDRVDSWH